MNPRIIEWVDVPEQLRDLGALSPIGLDCYCCGEDLVALATEDGLFYDGEPVICLACGWRTSTIVSEGDFWIQGDSADYAEAFDVRFNPTVIDVPEWVVDWTLDAERARGVTAWDGPY